jgi:Ser/Thr protein kinase RdoA (MazF antagonist)
MTVNAFLEPAQAALLEFGVDAAEVTLAAQAENVTFKVVDKAGDAYTLRFHRPGYNDLDELKGERIWTRALAQAGIAVPEPLATPDGRDYVDIAVPALDHRRWVGLARWVEGSILLPIVRDENASVDRLSAYFRRLGGMIAAMHDQAANWHLPAGFRRRRLDADGLAGPNPFWGRFWEHEVLTPGERALLIDMRDKLHSLLTHYGQEKERFSIIHADLHPGNILVNGETLTAIDFDDTAFGWHMFDLAVALHQCQDLSHFPEIYASCVEGYCDVRSVSEEDLLMVPTFLLMRGLAEIGWFGDRPENTTPEEMLSMKDFVVTQCLAFQRGTLTEEIDAFRRSSAA